MAGQEISIEINILYDGQSYTVRTYPNEYRNLMMLIYDKICPEDFGECLGMGKCGTCVVEIMGHDNQLTSYSRNEETTMRRSAMQHENVRLSCQILIDHHINGLTINVK